MTCYQSVRETGGDILTREQRYALNIKGLTYRTIWVEFPDIEAVAKQINAKALYERDGAPLYTLPMLFDHTTSTAITDSWNIVRYLDERYPATHVVIPRGMTVLQKTFQAVVEAKLQIGIFLYTVMQTSSQMNPRSREWYRRTREAELSRTLEEVAPVGSQEREILWKSILDVFSQVSLWMKENEKGTAFVCGKEPTFADFVIGSHLTWVKRVLGPQSKEYQELMVANGGIWASLVDGLARWEHVDQEGLKCLA